MYYNVYMINMISNTLLTYSKISISLYPLIESTLPKLTFHYRQFIQLDFQRESLGKGLGFVSRNARKLS